MKDYGNIVEVASVNKGTLCASTAFKEVLESHNIQDGVEVSVIDNIEKSNFIVSAQKEDLDSSTLFEMCGAVMDVIGFSSDNILLQELSTESPSTEIEISYIEQADEDEEDEDDASYYLSADEGDDNEDDEDDEEEDDLEEESEEDKEDSKDKDKEGLEHVPGDPGGDKLLDKQAEEDKNKDDPYENSLSILTNTDMSRLVSKLYSHSCGENVSRYPSFWAELDTLCSKYRKKVGFTPEGKEEEEYEDPSLGLQTSAALDEMTAFLFEEAKSKGKKKKFKKGRGGVLSAMMSAMSGETGDKIAASWDKGNVKLFKSLLLDAVDKATKTLKDTHPDAKDVD